MASRKPFAAKKASTEIESIAAEAVEDIRARVLTLRGQQVLLDADLAGLYGITTSQLVQAVKRNAERFPEDFMFQLSAQESKSLRSQFVISNGGRGGRRTAPYAFTEQGVAMLSGVLRSPQAVAANIEIMRTFVALRRVADDHVQLSQRVQELEREMHDKFDEHDEHFVKIVEALRQLTAPAGASRRPRTPETRPLRRRPMTLTRRQRSASAERPTPGSRRPHC